MTHKIAIRISLSEEKRQQIIAALKQKNKNVRQITIELKTSHRTVLNVLSSLNDSELENRILLMGKDKTRLSPEKRDLLIKVLNEGPQKLSQICDKAGVCRQTIKKYLSYISPIESAKILQLSYRYTRKEYLKEGSFLYEKEQEILNLRKRNVSFFSISSELQISKYKVRSVVHNNYLKEIFAQKPPNLWGKELNLFFKCNYCIDSIFRKMLTHPRAKKIKKSIKYLNHNWVRDIFNVGIKYGMRNDALDEFVQDTLSKIVKRPRYIFNAVRFDPGICSIRTWFVNGIKFSAVAFYKKIKRDEKRTKSFCYSENGEMLKEPTAKDTNIDFDNDLTTRIKKYIYVNQNATPKTIMKIFNLTQDELVYHLQEMKISV